MSITKLPTKPTPKKPNIQDQIILVYGDPKTGKTEFFSQFKNALFLATEDGHKHVSVLKQDINSWKDFLAVGKLLSEEKNHANYDMLVIDTLDNAYMMCVDYICEKHGISHPSDLKMGAGWGYVNGELKRFFTKLSMLPYGLALICHKTTKDIKARTGDYTRAMPALPDTARKFFTGFSDFIFYIKPEDVELDGGKLGTKSFIWTRPTKFYEAGGCNTKFPEKIELNYDVFIDEYVKATKEAK